MVSGQSYPLFIGESKTLSNKLIPENTVFFDQIVDDGLLLTIKPAGHGNDQKLKGMYDVRHCMNRLIVILFDNTSIWSVRIFAPYALFSFVVGLELKSWSLVSNQAKPRIAILSMQKFS